MNTKTLPHLHKFNFNVVFLRRNEIPVVYAGELKDEQEMLEWLIKNQSSADDDDTIEETDEEKLEIMVDNVDNLMIIFIDNSRLSTRVLDVMETIDDDCDRRDVVFVKVKVTFDDNGTKNAILDICSEDRVHPLLFPGQSSCCQVQCRRVSQPCLL